MSIRERRSPWASKDAICRHRGCGGHRRILLKERLRVFTALAKSDIPVRKPRSGLLNHFRLDPQIDDDSVVVVGDRAGHFGRGTVGEGTDTDDLSLPVLRRLLRIRHRLLKPLLLDQHVIAGIGNIYADEILHEARLRPDRMSDELGLADLPQLTRPISPARHFRKACASMVSACGRC